MDCFGFVPDDIDHPLSSPAGWGGKQDFSFHRFKQFNDYRPRCLGFNDWPQPLIQASFA
jgi:hypothetical protein